MKKSNTARKFIFKVGYVVRPSKLIIYENPKILDEGCSRNGFVIEFYIKISKLVIFTTYNHVSLRISKRFITRVNKVGHLLVKSNIIML